MSSSSIILLSSHAAALKEAIQAAFPKRKIDLILMEPLADSSHGGAVIAMNTTKGGSGKKTDKSHDRFFSVRIEFSGEGESSGTPSYFARGTLEEIKATVRGKDCRYGYEDLGEFVSELEEE